MSDLLKKNWQKKFKFLFLSMFYIGFFIKKIEWFAHSIFFGERCEQITQVAHQKWAMWANHSGQSEEMSDREQIAQVANQKWVNEQIARYFEQITHLLIFGQKTSDLLRKLISEISALVKISSIKY